MNMSEYESEPVPGLPEYLPEGEYILWQGSPHWKSFSRHVFHINKLLIYFCILIAWNVWSSLNAELSLLQAMSGATWIGVLTIFAISIVLIFSWLFSKTTIYTITNRRLVLRFGVAIPMIINLPWNKVQQADVKVYADHSGDIPLTLIAGEKISYFVMWPHAKPWNFSRVKPMLRSIPGANKVALIVAEALREGAPSADSLACPDKISHDQNHVVLN